MDEVHAAAFVCGVTAALDAIRDGHSLECVHEDARRILEIRSPNVVADLKRTAAERN